MNDLNTACFLSAARTKNFSATAKELSITQQAVSRSIRRMEEELGFPLFIRNSQSMQLSKGGEYYYQWLTSLDESLGWASEHFGDSTGAAPRRFRIAFCDWIGCVETLMDAAERLARQNPALSVEYLTGPAPDAFGFVEAGKADLAVLPETAAFYITGHSDTYISTPFCLAQLNLYANGDCLTADGALDRAALRRKPLLLPPLGGRTEEAVCRTAIQALGLDGAPETLQVPNLDSVYTETLCGAGYTISPANPAVSRIRGLQREPLPVSLPIVAVWLQNRHVPWAPVFTELLAKEVGEA